MASAFIEFEQITKRFAGVTALDAVSLSVARGECHALMGENGAGKSTLGKVLAGIYRPDSGRLLLDGTPRHFHSPADAARAGIGMVHQELAFCPHLSVAENLSLGAYPRRAGVWVNFPAMKQRAQALLGQIGVEMDVTRPIRQLSTAQEQLVQIAAAVGTGARILIFDEPTSSLSEPEAQRLFSLIDDLKERGVTMIYVSHRMPEVLRLCDTLSVLRDGRYVGTLPRDHASEAEIVRMMIGRPASEFLAQSPPAGGAAPVRLRVRNLHSPGKFANVSLEVKRGEIVGLAGLVGAGRSEVATAIFGLDRAARGAIEVDGKPLPPGNIRAGMRAGLGLVPEDRKRQGLVPMMGGRANFSLPMLRRLSRLGFMRRSQEARLAAEFFTRLRVKTPSLETPVAALSGGNQQKVALAKWLGRGAGVLIVDEPTRGVDVGAKATIHQLLDQLAAAGTSILLISSELPEVLALSHRILVMRLGTIVGELDRPSATQDRVLRLMTGASAVSSNHC